MRKVCENKTVEDLIILDDVASTKTNVSKLGGDVRSI